MAADWSQWHLARFSGSRVKCWENPHGKPWLPMEQCWMFIVAFSTFILVHTGMRFTAMSEQARAFVCVSVWTWNEDTQQHRVFTVTVYCGGDCLNQLNAYTCEHTGKTAFPCVCVCVNEVELWARTIRTQSIEIPYSVCVGCTVTFWAVHGSQNMLEVGARSISFTLSLDVTRSLSLYGCVCVCLCECVLVWICVFLLMILSLSMQEPGSAWRILPAQLYWCSATCNGYI